MTIRTPSNGGGARISEALFLCVLLGAATLAMAGVAAVFFAAG